MLANAYSKNYLVNGLPASAIETIAKLATEERFFQSDVIIRQGSEGSDLYIILEGTVQIVVGGETLNEIGPGAVFGEIALIDNQKRSADAVCRTNVTVAKFSAKVLREHMWANRDVGFVMLANLAKVLCSRLREASAKIDSLMDVVTDPWVADS
jgi:CRP-like cAMP-binding protein